jgi:hypothetical protein
MRSKLAGVVSVVLRAMRAGDLRAPILVLLWRVVCGRKGACVCCARGACIVYACAAR